MNPIVGKDEIRNAVEGIDLPVSTARPGHPSLCGGVRMGVELADYDEAGKDRRATQVDTRLSARRSATDGDLSGLHVHIDPAALLMASGGIIRQGILPSLFERPPDRRIVLQFCRGRRGQGSLSLQRISL